MDKEQRITILSIHGMKPDFIDFPIPELLQLTSMHQSCPKLQILLEKEPLCVQVKQPHECRNSNIEYLPFVRLSFPAYKAYPNIFNADDQLHIDLNAVCDRSVLMYSFILVLAHGKDYKDLKNNIHNEKLMNLYTQDETQRSNFQVFSGNRQLSREEQVQKIDFLTDYLELKGSIDIKKPTRTYWLCEYHKPFDTCILRPNHEDSLTQVFFGVEVAFNRKQKRHYTADYSLPQRVYLGPTSTTTPLAFLMSNMAQVQGDQVVLDPFVGTGGMLVPAAYFGAVTFGSDIDARVIHGYGVGHINKQASYQLPAKLERPYLFYNFKQYSLPLPELLRQDCLNSSFHGEFFDAIICDPPYGIRAAVRVTGKKQRNKKPQDEEIKDEETKNQESKDEELKDEEIKEEEMKYEETKDEETKTVSKKVYVIPTKKINHVLLYDKLFDAASKILRAGGMLVYLYPFDRDHGPATVVDIPTHPQFQLINFSEEWLTLQKSRILISMRKCQS